MMLIFQTVFLYLFLFGIMYFLCIQAKYSCRWIYVVLAILIYAVIFGLRYDVGADYLSYLESYKNTLISTYNINYYHYEPGFRFLIISLVYLKAHFSCFFGIVAFIQLYLIFSSIRPYRNIYPYLVLTFMLGCVWLSYANGLRQQLAFCLFALAIFFVERKKFVRYSIIVLLAVSMHKTAIILFLLYPLLQYKTDWFKKEKIQLLILLGAIIIGNLGVIQNYITNLENYATYFGYEDYFQDRYSDIIYSGEVKKGIGYYVLLIINIVLICNSTKYKQYYNCKHIYYIYNLYFIGVIMKYAFEGSQLLQRINYYFYGFDFIIGAIALFYAKKMNVAMYRILIIMYLLTFIATMYRMEDNTALFRFYWQTT